MFAFDQLETMFRLGTKAGDDHVFGKLQTPRRSGTAMAVLGSGGQCTEDEHEVLEVVPVLLM